MKKYFNFLTLMLCLVLAMPAQAQLFGGQIKPKRLAPMVSAFTCGSATFNPSFYRLGVAYTGTLTIPYTGGNGASYPEYVVTSTGNTSFTATLPAGTLVNGAGNLVFNVTGTSLVTTPANFAINFGGQSCNATLTTCGAFVAAGVWKEFLCHNLGANTSLNPNVPVQGIHGNYYQWGRSAVVANAATPAGAISGWNTSHSANGAWQDGTKTANDPCPAGYRVPTNAQWQGVINSSLNTVSRTGSWVDSSTNFGTAIHFGPSVSVKHLTLPVAGYRLGSDGSLAFRGSFGLYWSSTQIGTTLSALRLWVRVSDVLNSGSSRLDAFTIRCISQ